MPETKDLILKHPELSDWRDMYQNLWSHAESARYMLWEPSTDEASAEARMQRTIAFQKGKPLWTIYEKKSGQAIGFAGIEPLENGVCQEAGIAIGPAFVGRGYGKQILNALIAYARSELDCHTFWACCREQNTPSRGMILSCGFSFSHAEKMTDPRNGKVYIMEHYKQEL